MYVRVLYLLYCTTVGVLSFVTSLLKLALQNNLKIYAQTHKV